MFFSLVLSLSLSQFVSWFVFQFVFGFVSQFVYWLIICPSLKPPCKLLKPSVLVGRSVVLSFFGIYWQFLHQCPCPNGWKGFFLLLLPTACVSGQPSPLSALQVFFKRMPGKKKCGFSLTCPVLYPLSYSSINQSINQSVNTQDFKNCIVLHLENMTWIWQYDVKNTFGKKR